MGVLLEKPSPCKVNLLLNILGKRADGYHELETVLYPIRVCDRLILTRAGQGIQLSCNTPSLPTDARNLVYRAVAMFLEAANVREGVRLELQKNIPLAAGLGGGSGNAATTLPRLLDMGLEPYLVASTVTAAIGQRLVRSICMHCKVAYKDGKDTFYKGEGCGASGREGTPGQGTARERGQAAGLL